MVSRFQKISGDPNALLREPRSINLAKTNLPREFGRLLLFASIHVEPAITPQSSVKTVSEIVQIRDESKSYGYHLIPDSCNIDESLS